jgi:hypothetical protein
MVELSSLLESLDRPLGRCRSFLEFASGFGRFSRHLVKALRRRPPRVGRGARQRRLPQGTWVWMVLSVTRPATGRPAEYEVIFVLSLFSHLPESTWSVWLSQLYNALEDNGILIITTHGEKFARMMGVEVSANGFLFIPSSESTALSGERGSTFTSADYVRQAIAANLRGATTHEFPSRFWATRTVLPSSRAAEHRDRPPHRRAAAGRPTRRRRPRPSVPHCGGIAATCAATRRPSS